MQDAGGGLSNGAMGAVRLPKMLVLTIDDFVSAQTRPLPPCGCPCPRTRGRLRPWAAARARRRTTRPTRRPTPRVPRPVARRGAVTAARRGRQRRARHLPAASASSTPSGCCRARWTPSTTSATATRPVKALFPRPIPPRFPVLARAHLWCLVARMWRVNLPSCVKSIPIHV